MTKTNKYPLRQKLLVLPVERATGELNEYIRSKVADSLGVPVDALTVETDFDVLTEQLKVTAEQKEKAIQDLYKSIKDDLNIHFYYFEKKISTISRLSQFLAKEIQVIWNPAKPEPVSWPARDPEKWPWILPDSEPVKEKIQKEAIFVLSCPRSGSTIFRLILAGHAKLFSPPELHILPFQSMKQRKAQLLRNDFEWMRYGLVEALVELEKLEHSDAIQRLEELEENDTSIQDVYRLLQDLIGDRILVDKTPFYACSEQWLARAEELFENPKYIFLTRHPYGMINSFVKLRLKDLTVDKFGLVDDNPWRLAEKWWANGNDNIYRFLQKIPDERKRTVRYEDYIADSSAVVPEICDFIGVEFNDDMLNPYENNSKIMIEGIGDPNIASRSRIDSSVADAWKKTPPPQDLCDYSVELAYRLGYSIP